MLTKAEIQEWQNSRVTHEFFEKISQDRNNILDNWAVGSYTAETSEGTAQLNSAALGQIRAIDDVLAASNEFHLEGAE